MVDARLGDLAHEHARTIPNACCVEHLLRTFVSRGKLFCIVQRFAPKSDHPSRLLPRHTYSTLRKLSHSNSCCA